MKRFALLVLALGLGVVAVGEAQAQYVTYFRPTTTYYAPAPVTYTVASPVIAPAPVVTSPAVVAAPVTPVPVLEAAPTVAYYPAAPAPTVTYYAPAAPAPTVTYYAPAPAPRVGWTLGSRAVTRYRPILGGTVTRVVPTAVPVVAY